MHEESEKNLSPQMLSKLSGEDEEYLKKIITIEHKTIGNAMIPILILMFLLSLTLFLNQSFNLREKMIALLLLCLPWIVLSIIVIAVHFRSRSVPPVYQGAARGKVIKMEVIHQTVHIKSNNELMPYQRPGMPEYRDKPASYYSDRKSQPFYYLTIQLENSDKQLRYVNCTKQTFDQLHLGDAVLAVYYGNDRLIGYQIKSEEH